MIRKIVWILVVCSFLWGMSACAKRFQLQSGNYVMSIKLSPKAKPMPQEVSITVEADTVTITNPKREQVLTGTLKDYEFMVLGEGKTQTVEFTGRLVKDNTVEGKVLQKSGDSTLEAEFSIVRSQPHPPSKK
ncbi:MAG: hypothetical protein GY866_43505 [Proteobacteria bacterium]|nr:hypothetical protein [Pseudomonadota bacterium]